MIVAALPIGELDTDLVRKEFDAIIAAFNPLEIDLIVADSASDEASAQKAVQGFSERNLDLLLVIPLQGLSAPIIETAARTSHAPCLIWPVQGRFALPSSTLAIGALRESGVPVELLYAPPDQLAAIERLQCILKAAKAFSRIKQSRIGVVGGLFPNLVSCRYDPQIVNSRLGTTFLPISFSEIRDSMQSSLQNIHEIEQSRDEIVSSYGMQTANIKALEAGINLHLVLKQIAREQKLDAFATECWSGLPRELGLNPCLGFIEDAYVLACEGDGLLAVSLLLVRYLTGTSAYVGDLYDLDLDGILTLIHCGAPASLASGKNEVVLGKSQLAMERGFETITCRPRLANGPVTLFRFYGQDCDKMHVASGEVLSSELSPNLTVKIKLNGNRWDFLEQTFGNHYLVVAGDIRNELKLLCKWLAITLFET